MRLFKDAKGFSLIEVVVATTILVVVLVPMISTLLRSQNIMYIGRDRIIANNLVTQAAEEMRATGDVNLSLAGNGKFSLSKNVTPVSDSDNKLEQVNLEVSKDGKVLAKLNFLLYVGEEGD